VAVQVLLGARVVSEPIRRSLANSLDHSRRPTKPSRSASGTLPKRLGTEEAPAPPPAKLESSRSPTLLNVIVPLVSDVHTRLVDRTTLKLSFRLSVKARVRLIAQRKTAIVASTARQDPCGRQSLAPVASERTALADEARLPDEGAGRR